MKGEAYDDLHLETYAQIVDEYDKKLEYGTDKIYAAVSAAYSLGLVRDRQIDRLAEDLESALADEAYAYAEDDEMPGGDYAE